ncbi:hypothetical protein R1flu_000841 [Riccia fluitans]|uniref:heme oxygenase (biliverdin-producing) n=1 Tax=Riccia fluitans TaxID=41844 RepID=A0ABD1Y1J9_9MARC
MDVVMVHRNLTRNYLVGKGNEFRSVSWTECDACGTRVRPGGTRWPWSSGLRWPNLVLASAADNGEAARKGFGIPKKGVKPVVKKGGSSKGDQQQKGVLLNNAARTADREGSAQLSKVIDVVDKKVSRLCVDPDEAKKGKVDFVRVQTWGEDEESGKLENLRVKSFSPAVTSSAETSAPFYVKLVNRLQLLESKGEIAVAQVKPLPSFDRWVFGDKRYVQFLVDQRAVFQALRDVIARIRKERCGSGDELGGAARAVSLFAENLGLDRCKALDADISSLAESLNSRGHSLESITTSTQSASYAKYLRQLGSSSLGNDEKAKDACLKLLAHVFTNYVSHLTTGMRIGAKAMDNIVLLRQTNGVSFYRDYQLEGKEPLQLFIQTMNSAGLCVSCDDDHEQIMEELPKAMQRTSVLLSVLAVEEQALVVSE